MNDLPQLLRLLQTPTSAPDAAARLGWSRAQVEGLLPQLQARGMVSRAEPGQGACRPGCGSCSMQSFCPSSEGRPGEETDSLANNPPVWRLTQLGERTISP